MEKVEQGLLGERHVGRLARSVPDLLVPPEEARVHVAIDELPERCPLPGRVNPRHIWLLYRLSIYYLTIVNK